MAAERRVLRIVGACAVLCASALTLSSETLQLSTTYPSPVGIYNQIITTGDSTATPKDTTLNRNAGNTILIPPTNANGKTGIGTLTPAAKLDVSGEVRVGATSLACAGAAAGSVRYQGGQLKICDGSNWLSVVTKPLDCGAYATCNGSHPSCPCDVANPQSGNCTCPAGCMAAAPVPTGSNPSKGNMYSVTCN